MFQKQLTKFLEYTKDNPEGYWFKAKWYGWGWTPVKWQGYVSLIIFILIVVLDVLFLESKTSVTGEVEKNAFIIFMTVIIFSTLLLIFVCYKKGETPRWNWGDPRERIKNEEKEKIGDEKKREGW